MTERPDDITSHSELSTLAQCEMKWWLRYHERRDSPPTGPMFLGTIMHEITRAWWEGEDGWSWTKHLQGMIDEYALEHPFEPYPSMQDEPWITAVWLMERYIEHYAELRETMVVVHHELDVVVSLPMEGQRHRAIIDAVWQDPFGDYWMVERKTYGKKDRLELVTVDPQLTLNLWAVQQHTGLPFRGIVFDGIYTYRWKRDPHPTSDSFEMLFLDRNQAHIAGALDEVEATLLRRNALRSGGRPIRNIGPLCKGCGVKSECFSRLAFPNEIVLEDE